MTGQAPGVGIEEGRDHDLQRATRPPLRATEPPRSWKVLGHRPRARGASARWPPARQRPPPRWRSARTTRDQRVRDGRGIRRRTRHQLAPTVRTRRTARRARPAWTRTRCPAARTPQPPLAARSRSPRRIPCRSRALDEVGVSKSPAVDLRRRSGRRRRGPRAGPPRARAAAVADMIRIDGAAVAAGHCWTESPSSSRAISRRGS